MNVQQIIDRARRLAYVDSTQYINATALEDFNIVYHDIENEIVSLQEDFFWDIFKTDTTVINQTEYTLPADIWSGWTSLNKNIWVSIKYKADWDYIKARRVNINNLENDLDWYAENQSEADPIYHISDNSYFVYPKPREAVVNWIKTYWIKNLADLLITDTELFKWKIPSKYFHIIALGMLEFIYQSRWMLNEANNAKQRYEIAKKELLDGLKHRDVQVIEVTMPNLSHLS